MGLDVGCVLLTQQLALAPRPVSFTAAAWVFPSPVPPPLPSSASLPLDPLGPAGSCARWGGSIGGLGLSFAFLGYPLFGLMEPTGSGTRRGGPLGVSGWGFMAWGSLGSSSITSPPSIWRASCCFGGGRLGLAWLTPTALSSWRTRVKFPLCQCLVGLPALMVLVCAGFPPYLCLVLPPLLLCSLSIWPGFIYSGFASCELPSPPYIDVGRNVQA